MKNIINKGLTFPLLGITAGLMLIFTGAVMVSCSDWTDTESIDIKGAAESANYQKYLSELRAYKNSDHKILYAWLDNPQEASSMGYTIAALPDSVDVVNLLNPRDLPQWTVDQIADVRSTKGTRTVYTIDYPALEAEYRLYVAGLEDGASATPFNTYLSNYLDEMIPLCTQYGFDGIALYYTGSLTLHMTDEELAEYQSRQSTLMSRISEWKSANSGKMLIIEGNPENLLDKSILDEVEFFVLRTEGVSSTFGLTKAVYDAIASGDIPTDRFVVTVQTRAIDISDERYGMYYDENGDKTTAIPLAAE